MRFEHFLICLGVCSCLVVYSFPEEPKPKAEEPEVVKVDTNKPPIVLQSVEAKKTNAPPRIPVYVLPEVIEVRIPGGMRFIFVEQYHMQELAKKFPAIRYTNIIIYNDGL